MDPQSSETPKRKLPWRTLLLGLSLALNLLVIGAVVGVLMSARDSGAPERPGAELRAAGRLPLVVMLPRKAREDVKIRLKTVGLPDRRADRAIRQQVKVLLSAPTVDPEALTALFAENRALRDARARAVDRALIEVLVAMPQADRIRFAERLERRGHGHHEGKKH